MLPDESQLTPMCLRLSGCKSAVTFPCSTNLVPKHLHRAAAPPSTELCHLHALRRLVLIFHHHVKSCLALKELVLQQHLNCSQ